MDAPGRVWRDLQENTTLSGVVKLRLEKVLWRRLVWLIVLSTCAAFVVFQIGILFGRFFASETRSNKVSVHPPIPFPSVTICNQNAYKLSEALTIPQFGKLLDTFRAVTNSESLNDDWTQLITVDGTITTSGSGSTPRLVHSTFCTCFTNETCVVSRDDESSHYACVCVYSQKWHCYRCPHNQTCHYRYHAIEKEAAIGSAFKVEEDKIANQVRLEESIPFIVRNLDEETIDRLTYKYEELFRGCMFGSDRCDESNFTSTFDIKYGKCFSFNFNDSTLISVSKTGSYQGLKLLLYSNLSDYFEITDTSGMRVVIHHQNTHPFASIRGHDAPIGMITTFSIKSSIASRISYGPHKCSTLNPSNFAYHGRYTPEACQRICFQRHYRLECGCIDARFPKMEDSDVFCSIDNIYQRACLNNVSVRITEIETGACDCPRACIEATFASTISKAPLRDSFITFDPTNKSSHKDYVMLSVYYSSLSVDSLVEFPSYTFSNLISDLGGTVGFWLSMSLIGLYELVIFLSKLFTASLIYFRSFYVNRNISRVINLKSTYSTDEINNTERTINPTRRDWNYRLGRYRSEIEKGLVDKRQRHFIDLARILGINPSRVHQVHSNKLFQ